MILPALLPALALVALLSGCGGREVVRNMFPAPIIMQDERLDFSRVVAPEDRVTEVRVLFATTRAPAPSDAPERFTDRAGDRVRLGVAQVRLGEPGWSFDQLAASDRKSRAEEPRPARVVAVDEFGEMGNEAADQALIDAIDQQLERSPSGSVVIYVPGYRATFDQVITLMGTWRHYLARASPVVAFSWPTRTRGWSYLFACPRARAFVPDIARLVALVGERSRARRVNLIGFSCGGPLLAEALVQLREAHRDEDHEALQRRYRIANAIFV